MVSALFIASRLARGKSSNRTDKLLWLSISGIVISTLVILISLSVILGFKRQVSSIAYSQTGHISLYPYGENWLSTQQYIDASPKLIDYLERQPEIKSVSPLLQDIALLKTKDDFKTILLYGIEGNRYNPFFSQQLFLGRLPNFSQYDTSSVPLVLPSAVANRLDYKVGDKVRLYFLTNRIKIRAFTLVGIYQSAGLSEMPALCPHDVLQKIKGINEGQYNRIALTAADGLSSTELSSITISKLSQQQIAPIQNYGLSTAEELMPDIFSWLSMLDSNVIFLIVVMLIIGAFTMISGVIIIILDKTAQIGILKALGASNRLIRQLFTWIALRFIVLGIVFGNVLALLLIGLQYQFKLIPLNPEDYYMDSVPVVFDAWVWLAVNLGVVATLLIVVLLTTRIIASIKPSSTMKFE